MSKREVISKVKGGGSMEVGSEFLGATGEQAGMSSVLMKKGKERKNKNEKEQKQIDKKKFFIDVSKEAEEKEMILKLIAEANNKSYGREILLKDLVVFALSKLTSEDIGKIQENSLSEMEKVNRLLDEHNKKNGTNLELGEFLVSKLNIN